MGCPAIMAAAAQYRPCAGRLVDAVAAGGVAENVDAVRIDAFQNDQIFDEPVEHAVDVPFVPEAAGVGRRSRREIEPSSSV